MPISSISESLAITNILDSTITRFVGKDSSWATNTVPVILKINYVEINLPNL